LTRDLNSSISIEFQANWQTQVLCFGCDQDLQKTIFSYCYL